MEKVLAALKALAILGGIWGILLLVGWIAGVLPPLGGGPGTGDGDGDAGVAAEATDAGSPEETEPDAGAAPVVATPVRDAGAPDDGAVLAVAEDGGAGSPAAPPTGDLAPSGRHRVCDGSITGPTLTTLQAVGDTREDIAVGCAATIHLIALDQRDVAIGRPIVAVPVRVARLDAVTSEAGSTPRAALALAGDVTGDGWTDLLAGFVHVTPGGQRRGGSLSLVPGEASGAFGAARELAPIAAVAGRLVSLDGRPGSEVVALNQPDTAGRRPSEAWVFDGGGAPSRRAKLTAGGGGEAVAVLDLDRDGATDIVVAGRDSDDAHVFFGDGTGGYPIEVELPLAGARELVVGDVDGDGADDLVGVGEGLALVRAGARDGLSVTPIEAPPNLRSVRLVDLDGDGRLDVAGLGTGSAVWLRQDEAGAFEARELFALPSTLGGHALALAELDGLPGLDAAILGKGAGTVDAWELVVVSNVRRGGPRQYVERAIPLRDAPLSLRIRLP